MTQKWAVLKFGGSSVAEPSHWETIARQVQIKTGSGFRPLLVLSALKNVSNLLESLLHQSITGSHPDAIAHLKELHSGFAKNLDLDGESLLAIWFAELEEACREIHHQAEITPRLHARVLAVGELLSSTLGANFLNQQGIPCHWRDSRQLLQAVGHSDPWHHYTSAQCNYYSEDEPFQNRFKHDAHVIVTQGFIASDKEGETVLLGREGSDTSAAYFGALLQARQIEIWTDVPGIFTFNPRVLPDARLLHQLSYDQARRLATFGAKVLHPRTIQPAESLDIPILVRSTQLPLEKGTLIASSSHAKAEVIALATEVMMTRIKVEKDQISLKENILPKLLNLGFEPILDETTLQEGELLIRYFNTDQPQPTEAELYEILQENTGEIMTLFEVDSQLALITLIGQENGEWMNKVKYFCGTVDKLSFLKLYSFPQAGRFSLLVKHGAINDWTVRFHQEFIELDSDNDDLGDSWSSFCHP